jgi:hypothetical protein
MLAYASGDAHTRAREDDTMPIPRYPKPCPECGSSGRQRRGVEIAGGRLHLTEPRPHVPAATGVQPVENLTGLWCTGCGYVALFVE